MSDSGIIAANHSSDYCSKASSHPQIVPVDEAGFVGVKGPKAPASSLAADTAYSTDSFGRSAFTLYQYN